LPPGWRLAADDALALSYQLASENLMAEEEGELYLRTTTGNLYSVWPRWTFRALPHPYLERGDNFSLAFFGRAEAPWRWADQEPMSLVFFLRPREVPATFIIHHPRVLHVPAPR
jgi:hypothetical protein